MKVGQSELNYIKMIKEVKLWNSGYVQLWDFSKSNSSQEARVEAITEIARVCRGDKEIKDREILYNQLLTEHNGGPGEVFQFIPKFRVIQNPDSRYPNQRRFGIATDITYGNQTVRSNLRAGLADGDLGYNDYIDDFYVFKIKVPLMIVPHLLKHGQLSFMQQSERHCKLREYYHCDELGRIHSPYDKDIWNNLVYTSSQDNFDYWQKHFLIRQELTNKGSHGLAYTTLWIAGWKQDPTQWDNFFAVRLHKAAQKEARELAEVMKQLMENNMESKCEHEVLELMHYEYADDDVFELNFHCCQCGKNLIDSYQFIRRRENEAHQL